MDKNFIYISTIDKDNDSLLIAIICGLMMATPVSPQALRTLVHAPVCLHATQSAQKHCQILMIKIDRRQTKKYGIAFCCIFSRGIQICHYFCCKISSKR